MNEAAVLGGPRASAGEHDADAVSAGIAGSEAASALADFLARHPWLGAVIASFAAREPEAPASGARPCRGRDRSPARPAARRRAPPSQVPAPRSGLAQSAPARLARRRL